MIFVQYSKRPNDRANPPPKRSKHYSKDTTNPQPQSNSTRRPLWWSVLSDLLAGPSTPTTHPMPETTDAYSAATARPHSPSPTPPYPPANDDPTTTPASTHQPDGLTSNVTARGRHPLTRNPLAKPTTTSLELPNQAASACNATKAFANFNCCPSFDTPLKPPAYQSPLKDSRPSDQDTTPTPRTNHRPSSPFAIDHRRPDAARCRCSMINVAQSRPLRTAVTQACLEQTRAEAGWLKHFNLSFQIYPTCSR